MYHVSMYHVSGCHDPRLNNRVEGWGGGWINSLQILAGDRLMDTSRIRATPLTVFAYETASGVARPHDYEFMIQKARQV